MLLFLFPQGLRGVEEALQLALEFFRQLAGAAGKLLNLASEVVISFNTAG